MKSFVAAGLVATLIVAGCGTRLNPMNWFGSSEETVAEAPAGFTQDARPLVAQVTELRIERVTTGAIIRATGLPPTQGYWDAELVPTNLNELENGELIYEFRLSAPLDPAISSTARSRDVFVAADLSQTELQGVRRVTVIGASNRRTVRR